MPKKHPKLICRDGQEARALRNRLGINQADFWGRIVVKQSAGSRYELEDNPFPLHVACLLHIAYGTPAQAQKMIDWLRRPEAD